MKLSESKMQGDVMEFNFQMLNQLRKEYGDSFYLMDTAVFRDNYNKMLESFRKIYAKTRIAYSYKTNYTPKLCRMINELGGAAEIVSEMEMWLAGHLGVSGEDIYYNGPYKKKKFVEELLLAGGHINLDADYEVEMLQEIAQNHPQKNFKVGVRCNVDIGQEAPSRFGFDVASGALKSAVERLNATENIHASGLHCHIPFRTLESFEKRMEALYKILDLFPDYPWEYISLGGGYMGKVDEQIASQLSFVPPTFEDYAAIVAGGMKNYYGQKADKPMLIIEPGSALVANAAWYVMRVINIKQARDKQIASLTGSSYQVNPSVKDIKRPIRVYHDEGQPTEKYEHIDMAGYTCIESDYLYKDYQGKLAVGDYVMLGNIGSYSVVMKPPFILPDIPILEIGKDGITEVLKRAQTPQDVFAYYS